MLLKCLKGYVLGHPWALNASTGQKHWWNLTDKNKLRWKTCLLVTSEILGLFVNTTDGKHSCYKTEKFAQAIQMQLSKKNKKLLSNLYYISGIYIKILVFWKKHQAHSLAISVIVGSERSCYLNVLKGMFYDTFGHSMCWLVQNTD